MTGETRIAVVQHGDYREALSIVASGVPEPYFGMRGQRGGPAGPAGAAPPPGYQPQLARLR